MAFNPAQTIRHYGPLLLGPLVLLLASPWLVPLLTGAGAPVFALLTLVGLALLFPGLWLARRLGPLATENRQLRRLGIEAERRYRQLLDNAGDAIFLIHPETGAFLEINRGAEQLLGYNASELRQLPLDELFPGRERRRYLRLVNQVLRDGYGEEPNLRLRRRDGQLFHGAVHARCGELGMLRVVHGVLRDVTEIKRIEQELRQKNRDLELINDIARRAASDRAPEAMLKGVLEAVIAKFAAVAGGIYLVRHQGTELHLLVHQGIAEPVLADLQCMPIGQGLAGRVAANGKPRSTPDLRQDPRVWSTAASEQGWRSCQAIPLSADRRTVGVLFFFTRNRRSCSRADVNLLLAIGRQVGTAIHNIELYDSLRWQYRLTEASNRELEQSRQQLHASLAQMELANRTLEQTERMKNHFLTLASHELRTPLTYVLSGAELLGSALQGRLNADETRVLQAIQQGGQRLHEIVQDLLDIARFETKSGTLAQSTVHLPSLLTEAGQEFQPVFHQRALTFHLADLPDQVLLGDPRQLGKTFRRLLENAVKFTPEGGRVEVAGRLRLGAELVNEAERLCRFSKTFFSQPPPPQLVQITVRDTGVGIEPEEQVRIFDKFYEIGAPDSHFTSRTRFGGKGVGLGLSLVKGVVEAHGGMTWVESPGTGASGGGSAFHVLLPLPTANENGHAQPARLSGHSPAC